jgi:regulation of enolase protein 1 (concanavalin A-like superfamily)
MTFSTVRQYSCAWLFHVSLAAALLLLSASQVLAVSVTAMWNPSPGSIAGYRLSYGTQSGNYTTTVDVGNSTTAQLNLSPGRYYFAVRAYDSMGQISPFSAEVMADVAGSTTPPPSSVPSPWLTQDIGNPSLGGSANFSSGTFTVAGSGDDIWNANDHFRFVYQPLDGDGEIVARVTSLQNTHEWAKAGVMIRDGLGDNARHASALLTPSNGLVFEWRSSAGASSAAAPTAPGAVPQWVRVTRSGNTLTGYYSTNGTNWTSLGSTSIALPTRVYVGLAVSSINTSALNTVTFTNVAMNPGSTTGTLPAPWITQDIGSPSLTGAAGFASGTFTVIGSGADIWNASDQFRFVYQPLDGDGEIVARVTSQQNTHEWAKAGVMIRDSLSGNARHASALITPSNGFVFEWRSSTGASSDAATGFGGTVPQWVRVTRSGNTLTGYYSSDGSTWTAFGSTSIALPTRVYVGLAVTSIDPSARSTVTFTNAAVTGGSTGALPAPWLTQDVGSPSLSGAAAYASGTFTVNGSGSDIWNANDQFRFVYQPIDGDGEVVARVTALQNTFDWAKAGVMIRDSLNGNGRHASTLITPSNGAVFEWRSSTGASSGVAGPVAGAIPRWLRVTRSGNTLTGYYSSTGSSWTSIGSISIAMPTRIYVGLAVTSTNVSAVSEAIFTNVAVSGSAAATQMTMAAEPLTSDAVASDGSGVTASARTQSLDSAATTTSDVEPSIAGDFDGDGKADLAAYQADTGDWQIASSSTSFAEVSTTRFGGVAGDVPMAADYDGDGRSDMSYYRPSASRWSILESSGSGGSSDITIGTGGDVPVAGDFDGDGKADVAVYTPLTGQWQALTSESRFTLD